MTKKKKNSPRHVLLIWEWFSNESDLYLIPLEELDKRQRLWLRRCHGNYVNAGGTTFNGDFTQEQIDESLAMVTELLGDPNSEWLKNDPEYFERQSKSFNMDIEDFKKLYGSWSGYKIAQAKPKTIPRARVVKSGFMP